MAKIEIPLKKDYAGAFKYWVDTNTENGVCTIPEYICKGIVGMLGKQPVATDTNVGDKISRQAAVELVMKYCPDDDGAVQCDGDIRELLDELENLPPAQPERNKGEWLFNVRGCHGYTCPYCGIHKAFKHNFCPNCGADMREAKVKCGDEDTLQGGLMSAT